jgi:phage shock protein A
MTEPKNTTNDDVIARLASKGEQAVQRLADLPGGSRALQAFNDLKSRVDDLSKKMRGIDELEQRVAKLEKELAALKRAQKPASPKAPTRRAGA